MSDKTKTLYLRCTPELHEQVLAMAKTQHMSINSFLSSKLEQVTVAPPVETPPSCGCKCEAELRLRRKQMLMTPLCPDHRDKVSGLPCRQCEIERLERVIARLKNEVEASR